MIIFFVWYFEEMLSVIYRRKQIIQFYSNLCLVNPESLFYRSLCNISLLTNIHLIIFSVLSQPFKFNTKIYIHWAAHVEANEREQRNVHKLPRHFKHYLLCISPSRPFSISFIFHPLKCCWSKTKKPEQDVLRNPTTVSFIWKCSILLPVPFLFFSKCTCGGHNPLSFFLSCRTASVCERTWETHHSGDGESCRHSLSGQRWDASWHLILMRFFFLLLFFNKKSVFLYLVTATCCTEHPYRWSEREV